MGLFLEKYYSDSAIAANDIGAINYLSNVKTLDLYGLGSLDVAKARRSGDYDATKVRELALENDVEIIVIYDAWFEKNRPLEWIEVGKWQITNNVVCADDVVTFYVTKEAFKSKAIASLQGFAESLPADVVQSGPYLNP